MITRPEFPKALADALGIDAATISFDSRLVEDLALDSFDHLRLIIWIETTADVADADSIYPTMLTVADAYRYLEALGQAR